MKLHALLETMHMRPKRSWLTPDWQNNQGAARSPLRTFRELAADYGLTDAQLRGLFMRFKGPEARLNHKGAATSNSYYDPKDFKRWYDSLPADVKVKK